MIKFFLAIVLYLSSSLIGFCQQKEWEDYVFEYFFDNAPYIIEGEVLEAEGYKTEDNKSINTSHLIKIHKIFRGYDLPAYALECGTVEIITQGGIIVENGEEVEWLDITDNPSGPLKVGSKGLMLLFSTTTLGINRQTTNSIKLVLPLGPTIFFYKSYPWPSNLPIVGVLDRKFYEFEDFYQYLDSLGLSMYDCFPVENINEENLNVEPKDNTKFIAPKNNRK